MLWRGSGQGKGVRGVVRGTGQRSPTGNKAAWGPGRRGEGGGVSAVDKYRSALVQGATQAGVTAGATPGRI